MKTIAISPARGGSKGLLKKNLRKLDGESLIARAVRHAKEAKKVNVVLVTTDDEQIAQEAIRAGAIVPFIRPENLAGDLATTEETLKHALITYEKQTAEEYDICVFLTATDIFRKPEWIDKAITLLEKDENIESAFVGHITHKNFWELQEDGSWKRLRNWMSIYASRQVRRTIVREDTGLACASRASLWRSGRRIGDKVAIITNDDDFTSIDIHHEEDLQLAEAAISIRTK
jgi:CMP-N-acetylneuraminic acid synthetase